MGRGLACDAARVSSASYCGRIEREIQFPTGFVSAIALLTSFVAGAKQQDTSQVRPFYGEL